MTATQRVQSAYELARNIGRPELWITLLDESVVLEQAREIDRRVSSGEDLPLAGIIGALKDNIDLANVPTTAGCPAYSYLPEESAFCVTQLVDAGLLIIGKTNLDQFATGLVGTRSPYGAVACLSDASRVGGGSSSGSALVVAHGIVDVALGTDTAGSGRVPAAFNGIVGLKPTHGLISARGVVPACPTLDCVSIFARDVATAHRVLAHAVGEDREYAFSQPWSTSGARPVSKHPIVGVAARSCLDHVDAPRLVLYEAAIARMEELGATIRTVDIDALVVIGARLYNGGFVAERYASVGAFVDAHRDDVDPTVGAIIARAKDVPAHVLAGDIVEIARARRMTRDIFGEVDVLMLPTTGEHPTLLEVGKDPIDTNARLGRFTNFCNLLDLAGIAVPMPTDELRGRECGETFGVTLMAPAFCDQILAELAAQYLGEPEPVVLGPKAARVVVIGAHLQGEPLNYQLTDRGGRFVETTVTSDSYRLYALATQPPKPGLVRVPPGEGRCLEVEVWELAPDRFADFVTDVVSPLSIGPVELANGATLPGFLLAAAQPPMDAVDITECGGWRAFLTNGVYS